jgi:hypothetical protein
MIVLASQSDEPEVNPKTSTDVNSPRALLGDLIKSKDWFRRGANPRENLRASNDPGQVLFIADLKGAGINATNGSGIWIAHDVTLSGGEDGRARPFNDAGQIVFIASWKEPNGAFGSGVFVAGEVRMLTAQKVGDDIQVSFATALGRKISS